MTNDPLGRANIEKDAQKIAVLLTRRGVGTATAGTLGGSTWTYAGDMTIDATDDSADTTLYIKNSEATYDCNVDIDGDLTVAGALSVGSLSGGNITMADDEWIGLGAAAGRIVFDDQTPDEVNIMDAYVGVNNATPGGQVHIQSSGTAVESLIIQQYASQTAYATEWQDDGGDMILAVAADGDLVTDRWAESATNTLLGQGVVGLGNLTHAIGDTGLYNTGVGYSALEAITTGAYNTAVGATSLESVTMGVNNFAGGRGAGQYNETGNYNMNLGSLAGRYNVDGDYNVCIGFAAGEGTSANSYSYNILIGGSTGADITTASNCILIGYDLEPSAVDATYEMNIGGVLYGDLSNNRIGINIVAPTVALDVSGNVDIDGDLEFQDAQTISTTANDLTLAPSDNLYVTGHAYPTTTDTYDLGSSTLLWRKGWLSELDTIVFALNTITLTGGWHMIPKYASSLPAAISDVATQADLGFNEDIGAVDDFIILRSSLQVEYIQLTSFVSGTTWNFDRDEDGSGANTWAQGAPFGLLGYDGDGWIEMMSYDAGTDQEVPRISIQEVGTTYNGQTEVTRIGNMRNAYGIGANDYYGIGIGDYSGSNYLKYDTDGGFELSGGSGQVIINEAGLYIDSPYLFFGDTATPDWSIGTSVEGLEISNTASASPKILFISTNDGLTTLAAGTAVGVIISGANGNLGVQDGVYVGGTSTTASDGDLWTSNDVRVGGGIYVGGTGTDPATGTVYIYNADDPIITFDTGGTDWTIGIDDSDGDALKFNASTTLVDASDFAFTSAGKMYINDNANGDMTSGISINQGGADNHILALKSSDVGHGVTAFMETDTYGAFLKSIGGATGGGLQVLSASEATYSFVVNSVATTEDTAAKSTSSLGNIILGPALKSTTTRTNHASNANILVVRNYDTTAFLIEGNGDYHYDGTGSAFDEYDDAHLARTFTRVTSPDTMIRSQFDDFLRYNEADLVEAGILGAPRAEGGLVNGAQLQRLYAGAIWQAYEERRAMREEMESLMSEVEGYKRLLEENIGTEAE